MGELETAKHMNNLCALMTEAKLIRMDLSRCAANAMLAGICRAAGIAISEVPAMLAGPPCETFSPAYTCNISRGNEYRNYSDGADGERGPTHETSFLMAL